MYTYTFKNELTTDQKGELLWNTCGILFCRKGAKSTAIKLMQTVQGSLLWFLFCLILFLTSQSTNFQLCRRTQLKLRCAEVERGWQRVLTPSLENRKPLGLFSNSGPLENQKLPSQHSILGNYRPASVLLLGWWWSAFSGILIPHSIHLKKVLDFVWQNFWIRAWLSDNNIAWDVLLYNLCTFFSLMFYKT